MQGLFVSSKLNCGLRGSRVKRSDFIIIRIRSWSKLFYGFRVVLGLGYSHLHQDL